MGLLNKVPSILYNISTRRVKPKLLDSSNCTLYNKISNLDYSFNKLGAKNFKTLAHQNSECANRTNYYIFTGALGGLAAFLTLSLGTSPIFNESTHEYKKIEPISHTAFDNDVVLPEQLNHDGRFELIGYGIQSVKVRCFNTCLAVGIYCDAQDLEKLKNSEWKNMFTSDRFILDSTFTEEFINELIAREVKLFFHIKFLKWEISLFESQLNQTLKENVSKQSSEILIHSDNIREIQTSYRNFGSSISFIKEFLNNLQLILLTWSPHDDKPALISIDNKLEKKTTYYYPLITGTKPNTFLKDHLRVTFGLKQTMGELIQTKIT